MRPAPLPSKIGKQEPGPTHYQPADHADGFEPPRMLVEHSEPKPERRAPH